MKDKINEKISFSRYLACLAGICLLLTGCARLKPAIQPTPPSQRVSIRPVQFTDKIEISTQYAHSATPRMGYNTAEIYFENHTTNTVVFKSASLNGEELAVVRKSIPHVESITLDGEVIPLVNSELPPERQAVWWQFYPSPELKTWETIVCQINFRSAPASQQRVEIKDVAGKVYEVIVPRFRQPERLITAVTYPVDFSKIYIQYQSKHLAPAKIWLNNHEITGYPVLSSPGPDSPDMIVVSSVSEPAGKTLFPLFVGKPLHVKFQFPDGSERQALVRAQSGITLDAWFRQKPSEKEMEELGLDKKPAIDLMEGFDVACHDTKKKDKGSCAPAVVAERLKLYKEQQNLPIENPKSKIQNPLAGIGYCTAMYPELWNIYGQIADAVYSKPYRLWRGQNPARFIEEEEDCIEKARLSAMPRPFMWIPERFNESGRYIEPDEMKVLAWMGLLRGGKGIRYHFWKNPGPDPFAGCPLLLPAMKELNHEIKGKEKELSSLVLVSVKEDLKRKIKTYTAWSGDMGVLIMVRNLNYRTDAKNDNHGSEPRFRAEMQENVAVEIDLPAWLEFYDVKDFFTGKKIPFQRHGQKVIFDLRQLATYRILWIPNRI